MGLIERNKIDSKYKWDLSELCAGDAEWNAEYESIKTDIAKLEFYNGKLNNAETLLEFLTADDAMTRRLSSLYAYAKMKSDENTTDSKYLALSDKAEMLSVKLQSAIAFAVPEIIKLGMRTLLTLSKQERFADFSYALENIARNIKRTLKEGEEYILSEVGAFSDGFHDAFNVFDNADIRFDAVKDKNGKSYEMTHGMYSVYLQSSDRTLRKHAYKSMFGAFKAMANTMAALYSGNVKKNIFYAKMRKYRTALDMSADRERVSRKVYQKLVACVNRNVGELHKYLDFRSKKLNLFNPRMYDLHVPLYGGVCLKMSYEEAYNTVINALAPLGADYAKILETARDDNWIDVYESKGKRSGAYSWGVYGFKPYILLNYQETTHDVFTIAHELGHSVHSYYSNKNQPHPKAGYEIFVAEVASTVNEILLLKHLIANAEGDEKKYLLSYYLDMFRTTMFRQTQFAEFELAAHTRAENGVALTARELCDVYYELNFKYYGPCSDELISYEWARIPHFYRSFYVYKYATGIISAVNIARDILDNKNDALANYITFLSSGGSMPPQEILKITGVDLESDEPYNAAMSEFADALNELKRLEG